MGAGGKPTGGKHPGGRIRRDIARTFRRNMLILLAIVSLVLLGARFVRLGPLLERNGERIDYLAELARSADYRAVARLEVFELRRRFRAKVTQCTGLSATTRPYWLEEFPGRLAVRGAGERLPLLEIDFPALKAGGPLGDFSRLSTAGGADPRLQKAVVTAGLLGIYAPDRPCPPK